MQELSAFDILPALVYDAELWTDLNIVSTANKLSSSN
jgi:hypothetical protein